MRQVAAYIAYFMAALAEAKKTIPRLVLRAGKWVLEQVAVPPAQAPAAVGAAADALAEASQAAAPAPAAAPMPAPLDPATEWGRLAHAYVHALCTAAPEPDLMMLDDAARHWLVNLDSIHALRLRDIGAKRLGEHMLGIQRIVGLPACPTMQEFRDQEARRAEGQAAINEALEDLIKNPEWYPRRGFA